MDIDISRWILEFILRQPIEDRVANSLLSVLPFSDNDLRLKKTILLRRISSEISKGFVSEKILESLEMIEELDYREGSAVLDSMKAAYCAVAVDCTVKFLRESSDKHSCYFDAVKRIWRGRVREMEMSENVGLVSDRLKDLRDEIEAATWNTSVCENASMKDTRNDALKSVRIFLAEAWEDMGPSFLEFAAQTMSEMGIELRNLDNVSKIDQVGERAAGSSDAPEASDVDNRVALGDDRSHTVIGSSAENNREEMLQTSAMEAEMPNAAEFGEGILGNKYDCLPSPEVSKLQEALKSSSLDLQAVVRDPLPDALNIAATVLSDMQREKTNQESCEENLTRIDVDVPHPQVNTSAEAVQANESNIENECPGQRNHVARPSLMERNSTARTYEWGDDSVESLSEGSPSRSEKIHLPTPKKRAVSPLKKQEIRKFARRRKIKKWSSLEEETLRTAVKKHGRGNWKFILNCYCEIFEERTEVDLKDKWRNMTR